MPNFIAHIHKNRDGTWAAPHSLSEHLLETAKLSGMFTAEFQSEDWGKAVGLAHDAGKGRDAWQRYIQLKSGFYDEEAHIEGGPGKVKHAIHGAELVEKHYGKQIGRILAYCIAGHHSGLPDWSNSGESAQSSLKYQKCLVDTLDDIDPSVIHSTLNANPSAPPWKFERGLDLALWIRMLFSCLVDADYLDTENYMDKEMSLHRGSYCSIPELLDRFKMYCEDLDRKSNNTKVNEIRRQIRSRCIQAAKEEQGIFSLSVPTGGGKTLSSLAFALEHARQHQLQRIIYVIPYTSIIEQNADVFRSALGDDQVVENHSSLDDDLITVKSRLAAENWDAPVIVTTNVQFFESLFAAKPGRCRKLHNIVGSVVILDEAQLVPSEFLTPILETMQLLVDHYRVSFVLSTATQPAFSERMIHGSRFKGLKQVREIMGSIAEVENLYQSLIRNEVKFPDDPYLISSWQEISEQLCKYEQVLCIVSDRKSCRELYSLMPYGTYHLSALMCGQHRSDIIREIKQRLKDGKPVRVISTQLVEAGVDFDFPIVFRAFAGLDSIAQAAGRCNREGSLDVPGKVFVFNPPRKVPMGILRKSAETTRNLISGNEVDPFSLDMFNKFFSELYWKVNSLDREGIIDLLDPFHNDLRECSIYFRTAANKFHIIDDSMQKTIFVPYAEGENLIALLRTEGPDRWILRKLQRYAVNINSTDHSHLQESGVINEIYPNLFTLSSMKHYSNDIGFLIVTEYDT